MRERLIVESDRFGIDRRNAERTRDLQDGLALRQLPQPTEQTLWFASREHELPAVLDPQRCTREHGKLALFFARGHDRQHILATRARGLALLRERAHQTARRRRRAHRRAELHQALVQLAGRMLRRQRCHQRAGTRPQRLGTGGRLDIDRDAVDPREHARDVTVDEWRALAKRDRRDRTGGVRPDAGDCAQLTRATGQGACPLRAHLARAVPQIACARVVAKACPRGEHVVERRRGEVAHRRELLHPALPVRDHGLHPRLLQHDLADPDRIRVTRPSPGQVAPVTLIVRDDRGSHRSVIHTLNCTCGSS